MIRKASISGLIIILAFMAANCSEDSSGPKSTSPTVSILKPATGSTRAGIVDIIVEATDDKGIDAVELYVGNTLVATDELKPYSFEFDMSSAGASVSIYVKAIDISGNTKKSSVVTITKGGSAPVITTGSADLTEVMQGYLVNLTGTATDSEDGTLGDANIAWSSSLQGPLREGTAIEYRGFVIGDHVITMTATDTNKNTAKKSFNLKVTENDQDFAYIQEGSYILGPPLFEERTVIFSRPFLISKTEYTLGNFIDNLNNDTFNGGFHASTKTNVKELDKRMPKLKDMNGEPLYPADLLTDADEYRNYPVCFVSAIEILEFCQALSKFEGFPEAYMFLNKDNDDMTDPKNKPTKYFKAMIIDDSIGWRLPTESEWEVAANAGSNGSKFPWGNEPAGSRANTLADPGPQNMLVFASGRGITPVASYPPNAYGLYDMAGNVGEMVSDFWQSKSVPFMGPHLDVPDPVSTSEAREVNNLVKGGTWYGTGDAAQIAIRQLYLPLDPGRKIKNMYNSGIGFRIVRNVDLDLKISPW